MDLLWWYRSHTTFLLTVSELKLAIEIQSNERIDTLNLASSVVVGHNRTLFTRARLNSIEHIGRLQCRQNLHWIVYLNSLLTSISNLYKFSNIIKASITGPLRHTLLDDVNRNIGLDVRLVADAVESAHLEVELLARFERTSGTNLPGELIYAEGE